jgi:hypothetical protein
VWEINSIFFLIYDSGCVTKWYQSMVTTLGLTGLMHQSHQSRINLVRNTPMRSTPDLTILSRIKNLEYEHPTVYAC